MRLFIGAAVVCFVGACDRDERTSGIPSEVTSDASDAPNEDADAASEADVSAPESRSVLSVTTTVPEGAATACYALRTIDANDNVWFEAGDPLQRFATRAEAEAAGQLCGLQIARTAGCGPGLTHEFQAVMTGVYTATGDAYDPESYDLYCTDFSVCSVPFTCAAEVDTPVDLPVMVMREARQGFFDIFVTAISAHEISDMCVSIAVVNADGVTAWRLEHLCSSQYGRGDSLTFIGTCDADAAANEVHIWFESISSKDPAAQFVNPCPADGLDPAKACKVEATCIYKGDVLIDFVTEL